MPEIINSILQDSIPSPAEFNPSVPPELEAIVYKATDKNRDRRYQTGEDFARALYEFADKHEGIASTMEVKNWYQSEFRQRIEQRRKFEQLVQEKADRIKKKTSNSGIISLPSTLDSPEKPVASTERPTTVQPVGPIIASKHTNPYLTLAVAFLLFIGGMIVIHQLFLKNDQAPIPQPPIDTKPIPSGIAAAPPSVAGDSSLSHSAAPVRTPSVVKNGLNPNPVPEAEGHGVVAGIEKPTGISQAAAEKTKASERECEKANLSTPSPEEAGC